MHGSPCTCLVQNSFGVLVQHKLTLLRLYSSLIQLYINYQGKVVKRLGDIADPHGRVRLKCGRVEDARRVLDDLPNIDMVTWNSMVLLTFSHGKSKEAIGLYKIMVLEAFSDLGLVCEGQRAHGLSVNFGFADFEFVWRLMGCSGRLEVAEI